MESLLSVLADGRRSRLLAFTAVCLALILILAALLALPTTPSARAVSQAGQGGEVPVEWVLPDGRLPALLANGTISTPTTWAAGPVWVTGTVSIVSPGSLTISPGVEVRFDPGTAIHVNSGSLTACGTGAEPITFTASISNPSRGAWAGLFFGTEALPSTVCQAVIEYAATGVNLADTDNHEIVSSTLRHNGNGGDLTSGGAILWVGDEGRIAGNEVYDNEFGMRFQKAENNEIVHNRVYDNDAFGIGFFAVNAAGGQYNTIADNDIYANGGFGLGMVGEWDATPSPGGNFNTVTGNRIFGNLATGTFPGDGIYLLYGNDNQFEANEIYQNAGDGIRAERQFDLVLTGNRMHHNGADGLAYTGDAAPAALHSNVLCSNNQFDIDSDWTGTLAAPGNWFGTNAPALGAEISGSVNWTPWISMAVAADPDVLHADGASTAAFTLALRGGGYAISSPYTVTVSPSLGSFVDPLLWLVDGTAGTTFVAGTTPGIVDVTATDICGPLLFTHVLTLEAHLDLAVTKSGGAPYTGPDETLMVSYTITVSNVGSVTSTAVVLTDVLPAGTSYEGGGWTCDAGVCTHPLPTLPPLGGVQVVLPLLFDPTGMTCPVVLTNVVQVADALLVDANPADNVFTLTTEIPCLPDLMIVKNDNVTLPRDVPAAVIDAPGGTPDTQPVLPCQYVGEVIDYLIAYTNWGIAGATNVVLTETLPAHTRYAGGAEWTHAGGSIYTHEVGALDVGAGGAIYFPVRVETIPPTQVVENVVRIGGAEEDLDPSDNESREETLICEGVLLGVGKEDNLPCAFPGDEVLYTIVITNPTGETISNLVVTDTLPAHTAYLASPGWQPAGGQQYTYDVGVLEPYTTVEIDFAVVVDNPLPTTVTSTLNIACAFYDDGPSAGVCATEITELPLEADLRVVKHDHVGLPPAEVQAELDTIYRVLYGRPYVASPAAAHEPVVPGDVFSYTITYLNMGREDAFGVVLTETLPQYVSYVGYGWTEVSTGTFVYDVGDLPVGHGGQVNFYVRVEEVPCSVDFLYNWVHIGSDGLDECNLTNNWSGEETWVSCGLLSHVYLPLVLKAHVPTPPPEPTPTEPPEPPTPPPAEPTPPPPFVSAVAVDPGTGLVYVASPELDAVLVVDPVAEDVIDVAAVGDHPVGLAVVTTTQKIYVANLHSWSVTALRLSDRARLADIYVGAQACRVAADPAEARVYAANHLETDNGVAAIDSQTDERLYWYERFNGTQGRYGIDVDAAADKIFVAARDAGLIAIQDADLPTTDPQIVKLDPARVPFVVAFNPTTEHLFVTAPYDNKVVVLAPYSIEWNRIAHVWYEGHQVALLDQTNAGWIKELSVGLGAEEGIAVNPRTGRVYVTNAGSDTVSVLQDATTTAGIVWLRTVFVGDVPQGVAVDAGRNVIYVANAGSRDLSVIDGDTYEVRTIPLD